MRARFWVVLSVMLAACVPGYTHHDAAMANRVETGESVFGKPRIQVLESLPPQFDLVFSREMPTPGWTFEIDAIDKETPGRIVVRVTERRPEGIVTQVITRTEFRLSLGTLPPGRYVLELHTRRGAKAEYRLVDALVLLAYE